MEDKNKKIIIIVGIIIAVLLIIVCCFVGDSSTSSTTSADTATIVANAQAESDAISDDEKKDLTEIDIDTYLEYYNGSEQKLILIARPTCSYCQIAEPIIQNIAYKYDFEINYLNTDALDEDGESKLLNSDEFFSDGFGTPLLLVVKDGSIVDKVDGLTDTENYLAFFKTYNYIS
jgi:thiol-disulfide isomerase/thioredoxin